MSIRLTRTCFGLGAVAAVLGLAGLGRRAPPTRTPSPPPPAPTTCLPHRSASSPSIFLDVEPALALGLPVVGYGVQEERLDWIPLPGAPVSSAARPTARRSPRSTPTCVIVCTDIPGSDYWPIDRLGGIAPVIPVDYKLNWQANLTRMGDWLGRRAAADQFIAAYTAELDRVKAAHAAAIAGRLVAAIWFEPDSSEVQLLLGRGPATSPSPARCWPTSAAAPSPRTARRIRRHQRRACARGAGSRRCLPARCRRRQPARRARGQSDLAAPAGGGGRPHRHGQRHLLRRRLFGAPHHPGLGAAVRAVRLSAGRAKLGAGRRGQSTPARR